MFIFIFKFKFKLYKREYELEGVSLNEPSPQPAIRHHPDYTFRQYYRTWIELALTMQPFIYLFIIMHQLILFRCFLFQTETALKPGARHHQQQPPFNGTVGRVQSSFFTLALQLVLLLRILNLHWRLQRILNNKLSSSSSSLTALRKPRFLEFTRGNVITTLRYATLRYYYTASPEMKLEIWP